MTCSLCRDTGEVGPPGYFFYCSCQTGKDQFLKQRSKGYGGEK